MIPTILQTTGGLPGSVWKPFPFDKILDFAFYLSPVCDFGEPIFSFFRCGERLLWF